MAKEFSKTDYKLPLFIKPCDGSGSIDNFIIRHKKEITSYHLCNEKLMFLEYIDQNKYDEFTCDLYYDKNSNLKCVVPRKRISIRSGEVEKGLTLKNNLVTLIKESLENIDGVIGCINIQLFLEKDGDKVYGIEINPRFGGGYPLSYLAGANYTKWIIEEYLLNKKIKDKFDSWESNLLMIRYDAEVIVHEFKNGRLNDVNLDEVFEHEYKS